MNRSLSVSLVSFGPDLQVLADTLASLAVAVRRAREGGVLDEAELILVDNGPGEAWRAPLRGLLDEPALAATFDRCALLSGHGNVGFGTGHNLAVESAEGGFHLVLNPDVLLDEDAVRAGLGFLLDHPEVALVSPAATWPDGERQYLCKRYPSVIDLALRGFAPAALRRRFQARLARYEMRDACGPEPVMDVPIASGCFMLFPRRVWQQVGGFDPRFFLYFEDFDLSLRLGRLGRLAYVPAVRIVHRGGRTARKGLAHVLRFAESGRLFFGKHGWKWV